MTLVLHNTLTKKDDTFQPNDKDHVTLYTCGPTVYDYQTVGNWTAYIYWDILVRTLKANGYTVERVLNITDVGHLVSDADEGQDKLEKGAHREGKTAWQIAEFYSEDFLKGMEKLGLLPPEHLARATDFITQQLDLVRTLKQKGYTYQIDDGIYFDTSKFPTYADFAGLDLAAQKAGARVEFNPEKRNPSDFALWKFTPDGEKRDMEWGTPGDLLQDSWQQSTRSEGDQVTRPASAPIVSSSPPSRLAGQYLQRDNTSGKSDETTSAKPLTSKMGREGEQEEKKPKMGFPGWHLECSAIAMHFLGPTLDIHTGGIDHIPVHHTNEIAEAEAATGKPFAHYWLHNNHLKVDGTKISKSLGNGYTLQNLEERGFNPLDFRMFILQGQYTGEGNFTFDNLMAAKNRRHHWRNVAALRHQIHDTLTDDAERSTDDKVVSLLATSQAVLEALNDNLNTPVALSIIDEAFSKLEGKPLTAIHQFGLDELLKTIDELLGLQLLATTPDISDEIKRLLVERQRARDNKDWETSDELRDQLADKGVAIQDAATGSTWQYAD